MSMLVGLKVAAILRYEVQYSCSTRVHFRFISEEILLSLANEEVRCYLTTGDNEIQEFEKPLNT